MIALWVFVGLFVLTIILCGLSGSINPYAHPIPKPLPPDNSEDV